MMTDETLRALADALPAEGEIARVSLVGNTKLGLTGRRGPDAALAYFVRKVGRRCQVSVSGGSRICGKVFEPILSQYSTSTLRV